MLYFFSIAFLLALLYFYSMVYESYVYPKEMSKINLAIEKGKSDRALSLLKKLRPKMTLRFETQYAFYRVYMLSNHWYLALYHLNEISFHKLYSKKAGVSDIEIHLKKADLYEILKREKDVLNEYYQILRKQPKHVLANEKIGNKLFQMKNFAIALPFLEKSFALQKDNSALTEKLADIYTMQKNFQKARWYIEIAIKSEETVHCRLKHKRISILYQLGEYDEIIETALSIDSSYKQSQDVHLILGLSLYHTKQEQKAFQQFQEILGRHLNNYSAVVIQARELYFDMLMKENLYEQGLQQLQFISESREAKDSYKEERTFFSYLLQKRPLLHLFSKMQDVERIQFLNSMIDASGLSEIPNKDGILSGFQKISRMSYINHIQLPSQGETSSTLHQAADAERAFSSEKSSAIFFAGFHHKPAGKNTAIQLNNSLAQTKRANSHLFQFLTFQGAKAIMPSKLFIYSTLRPKPSFFEALDDRFEVSLVCFGKSFLDILEKNRFSTEIRYPQEHTLETHHPPADEKGSLKLAKERQLHTVHAFLGKPFHTPNNERT